jgi:CrcB protein
MNIAALFAGGAAGLLARHAAVTLLPRAALPWGTMSVNLAGCFLIGLFDARIARQGLGGPHGRLLLITGFCGTFTTFSSLIYELDALLRTAPLRGVFYVLLSVFAGLALLRGGAALGGA